MTWIGCAGAWITEHATVIAAVVSAVATGVVAWFTVTLAAATKRLQEAGEKQLQISTQQTGILEAQADTAGKQAEITRLQHLASHRPRLRVRHVSVATADHIGHPTIFFNHGEKIRGGLAVVNVGGTKATIIESRYRIFFSRDGLPKSAPYDEDFHNLLLVGYEMDVGESCAVAICDEIIMTPPPAGADVELRQFEREGWKIYVMGQIRYQDEGGHDRFMGFCRVGDGKSRFRAVDDPDYEYED